MSIDKTATILRKKMPTAVPRAAGEQQPQEPAWRRAWRRGTLPPALLGSLLMWAALPPLDWWPLAWVAPIPWLMIIRKEALPGRRPYRALWLAGFVFWLGAVHWLRLPHPATSLGWIALSFYLAFYLPVFVGLTRAAVHRLQLPLVLSAPLVWTGLELAKGHLLTGFSMGLLGHTQVRWLDLIQVADFGGAYAVSFTVMFVAACLARMLPCDTQRRSLWPPLPAAVLLAAVLAYGHFAQSGVRTNVGPKVALIQGSIDTTMKADPSEVSEIHKQYIGLTRDALIAQPDLDLIVWPETMCRASLIDVTSSYQPGIGGSPARVDMSLRAAESCGDLQRFAAAVGKPMLLGVDTLEYGGKEVTRYNSAVWVDPNQGVLGRYDKMHPVMFGEYVPFADRFPFLYRLTPLGSGIGAGERLPAFELRQDSPGRQHLLRKRRAASHPPAGGPTARREVRSRTCW